MMTTHPSTPTASKRIATIDVMRAIIMLLMLFVNDIPGVDGLPHWLGHAETEEDHRHYGHERQNDCLEHDRGCFGG